MQTVYKYPLEDSGCHPIGLPIGSKILSLMYQGSQLVLYAQVNTLNSSITRRFMVMATGQPYDFKDRKYVGTAYDEANNYVAHVYEVIG